MHVIRKRLFVGCEGNGERALVTALQRFANERVLPIHLDPFNAHGGSPVTIVKRCAQESRNRSANRGAYDAGAFVMLDRDRIEIEGCFDEIRRISKAAKIRVIVQDTKLECVLGKLISGRFDLGPDRAAAELLKHWPDYTRAFDAAALFDRVSFAHLQSSQQLHEEWASLLKSIGLI